MYGKMDQVTNTLSSTQRHHPSPANLVGKTDSRRRPMRVLCVGLGRTSTSSLEAALGQFGYTLYTWNNLIASPPDHALWIQALKAKYYAIGKPFERMDWDELLGDYDATSDNPSAIFYKELIEAYPEALVILTVRDSPQKWFNSVCTSLLPVWDHMFPATLPKRVWQSLWELFLPAPTPLEAWDKELARIMRDVVPYLSAPPDTRERSIEYYNDHIAAVQALVPKERLLIYNAKDGWNPLCQFLKEKIPDTDYPRLNNSVDIQKQYADYIGPRQRQGLINMGTCMVVLFVSAALVMWLWPK